MSCTAHYTILDGVLLSEMLYVPSIHYNTVVVSFILCILNYDICHCHFMSWIGSVTSKIVSSLTSYLLYCLREDGHLSGRNL